MTATGGSIDSVTIDSNHFNVAGDAESQRKLGGVENEIQQNGNKTGRLIKTNVGWMLDGLTIEVDDSIGQHEVLQELANRNGFFPVTITYASGRTWQGDGQITGELQYSSQNTTAALTLGGPGVLTPQ